MKNSICAIIKDEHLFLKEWIDWHLGLGFDAIHLFEDKGSKSHEEICEKYSNVYLRRYENDNEIRQILSNQGNSGRQKDLYSWFAINYRSIYDWVAFIDIDEFLFFNEDYSLERLCNEYGDCPAILLYWKMMGASGKIKKQDNVIESYTEEAVIPRNELNWAHKVLCNLRLWPGMDSLHRTREYVNTNRKKDLLDFCYDKAWINHYFTKSWEDWCDRIFHKGGTQKAHRLLSDFFVINPSMRKYEKDLINSVSHLIPNGTYKLNRKGLIAGGNVSKIMNLNRDKSLKSIDFIDKKILLIGNKPVEQLTDEQIAIINSYDIIVRTNGMNNKSVTGNRVDWWWLNVWNWTELKNNLGNRDYSNPQLVMIDSNSSSLVNKHTLCDNLPALGCNIQIYYTHQNSTQLCKQEKQWKATKEDRTIPTTDIVCLSYLVEKFPFSEITITGLDVEDREELFKTHSNWCNTWHRNVGGLERDYIKGLISASKIKFLEL